MSNLINLLNQRNDVLSEVYHLMDNTTNSIGTKYVQGPFARSRCLAMRRKLVKSSSPFVWSTFKLHDLIDKYYLVFTDDNTGRILYDTLRNHRSLIRRLDKEIDKL